MLNALARATQDGLLLISTEGDIEFANDAALDLLGCATREELEPAWSLLRPRFDQHASRPEARTRDGATFVQALELESGARYLQCNLHRLEEDDAAGTVVLLRDQRVVSGFERQFAALSRIKRVLDRHRAAVHDIKTPMNALGLNVELLRDSLECDDPGDPRAREQQLETSIVIGQEIERLNQALLRILDPSSLEEEEEQFDLNPVLAQAVDLLLPLAEERRVDVEVEPFEGRHPVFGSAERMRRAFDNLLINAIEALPAGGQVKVRTDLEDEWIVVTIEDDGPGIPAGRLGSIFRMNYTTKEGGSGIGLHVVRSVMRSCGGELAVFSEVGRGTRFRMRFPRMDASHGS